MTKLSLLYFIILAIHTPKHLQAMNNALATKPKVSNTPVAKSKVSEAPVKSEPTRYGQVTGNTVNTLSILKKTTPEAIHAKRITELTQTPSPRLPAARLEQQSQRPSSLDLALADNSSRSSSAQTASPVQRNFSEISSFSISTNSKPVVDSAIAKKTGLDLFETPLSAQAKNPRIAQEDLKFTSQVAQELPANNPKNMRSIISSIIDSMLTYLKLKFSKSAVDQVKNDVGIESEKIIKSDSPYKAQQIVASCRDAIYNLFSKTKRVTKLNSDGSKTVTETDGVFVRSTTTNQDGSIRVNSDNGTISFEKNTQQDSSYVKETKTPIYEKKVALNHAAQEKITKMNFEAKLPTEKTQTIVTQGDGSSTTIQRSNLGTEIVTTNAAYTFEKSDNALFISQRKKYASESDPAAREVSIKFETLVSEPAFTFERAQIKDPAAFETSIDAAVEKFIGQETFNSIKNSDQYKQLRQESCDIVYKGFEKSNITTILYDKQGNKTTKYVDGSKEQLFKEKGTKIITTDAGLRQTFTKNGDIGIMMPDGPAYKLEQSDFGLTIQKKNAEPVTIDIASLKIDPARTKTAADLHASIDTAITKSVGPDAFNSIKNAPEFKQLKQTLAQNLFSAAKTPLDSVKNQQGDIATSYSDGSQQTIFKNGDRTITVHENLRYELRQVDQQVMVSEINNGQRLPVKLMRTDMQTLSDQLLSPKSITIAG